MGGLLWLLLIVLILSSFDAKLPVDYVKNRQMIIMSDFSPLAPIPAPVRLESTYTSW